MRVEVLQKLDEICGFLLRGNSLKVAVHRAGISSEVFQRWRLENPKISEAISLALAESQARLEEMAYELALESSSPKEVLALLAAKDPEIYNPAYAAKKLAMEEAQKMLEGNPKAEQAKRIKKLNDEARAELEKSNAIDVKAIQSTP